MHKIEPIKISPYNSNWPNIFAIEALNLKKVLGDNCLVIHHIGSTSVPGLAAKPIIDVLPVVRDILTIDQIITAMEALGYEAKGEFGMPLRRYFQKKGFNVHIFEQSSAEITGHLLFRDWMRAHADDRANYAKLKQEVALRHPHDIYQYVFGKDAFIKDIHSKTGFNGLRVAKVLTPREWAAAKSFRDKYFFVMQGIEDPHAWTFSHAEHIHLIFYQGTEIVGYSHLHVCEESRVLLQIIAINNRDAGTKALELIEKWLKSLGIKSIHAQSRQVILGCCGATGYVDMPFDVVREHEFYPYDACVGKVL